GSVGRAAGPLSAPSALPAASASGKMKYRMFKMTSRMWMVLLGAALTAAAPAAFPEAPRTRAAALQSLKDAETTRRAEAIVWIANHGGMADAPLLHERLRDESAFVRSFAERALWIVWSRSGDAAIDELLARGVEQMQAGDHPAAISTFS